MNIYRARGNIIAIITALLLALAAPAWAEWRLKVSDAPIDREFSFFAVAASADFVAALAYTGSHATEGPLIVAWAGADGVWRTRTFPGVRVESGCGLIPHGKGFIILTEKIRAAAYYWEPGWAHVEPVKIWAEYEYLLGGTATHALGYVIASGPAGNLGACVSRVIGCNTGCVVPPAFDPITGRGLIGWEYVPDWRGRPWIAGQVGLSRDHGRLLYLENGAWVDSGYTGSAIVQISFLPDGLMLLATATGQIVVYDGQAFALWFAGPPATDIRIVGEFAGQPVMVSAAGAIYQGQDLVMQIPGPVAWVTLVKIPGQDVLAGTLMYTGQPGAWGVKVWPQK